MHHCRNLTVGPRMRKIQEPMPVQAFDAQAPVDTNPLSGT